MIETQEYKGVSFIVTDEGPLGHPDDKYVISKSQQGWHVLMLEQGSLIHLMSGPTPLPNFDSALEFTKSSIERDIADQAPLEQGNYAPAPLLERQNQLPEKEHTGEEDDFPLPLRVVIDAHNALPEDSPLRTEIQTAIQAQTHEKWQAAGVLISPSGDLTYDTERAHQNLYRRKSLRYMDEVRRNLRKLRTNLEFSSNFHARSNTGGAKELLGAPLTALANVTPALRALTAADSPLSGLLDQVKEHEEPRIQFPSS